MDVIAERCAGLDVHRDTVVATVRVPGEKGGRRQQTQTFSTSLGGLLELQDWLLGAGVTLVGMESTGVYWKSIFYLLEDSMQCWLLNAEHLRNVPGKKTDVADSAWIAQMVEHGLIRPSFVPPKPIRELRDLTRHRRALVEERTRVVERLEKVLQDAGVKLSSVSSTILNKSGRAILEALLDGVDDPYALAELARGRLRSKIPQLREALAGRFRVDHHGILVTQMLGHVDFVDTCIAEMDTRIAAVLAPHQDLVERVKTIPGVKQRSAEALIAECGMDMASFPSAGHLASWAGICPGNHASAGKRKSGRTRKGSKWLRTALTESAQGAARARNTYLSAHFSQIMGRRGRPKAVGAIRHDILVAYYFIVRDGVAFRDLGADWAAKRFSPEHRQRRLVKQLEALGLKVTVEPMEAA